METVGHNGINPWQNALPRASVIHKLTNLLCSSKFVVMSSAAATGKTSILQLVQRINFQLPHSFMYIRMSSSISPYDLFKARGIDLLNGTLSSALLGKDFIILLDDAQVAYGFVDFWGALIKDPSVHALLSKFKFVISATYLLSGSGSPVVFEDLSRILPSDMLLSEDEAFQFLNDPAMGLPSELMSFNILKGMMVNECNGSIGALRIASETLADRLKHTTITETTAVQVYMSKDMVVSYG